MMNFLKEPLTWWITASLLVGVVIPGVGIYYSGEAHDRFETACIRSGGDVIRLRRDSLCVSPDGRILGDL